MRIEKILNNNVVLASNAKNKEIVVMGRGLAFQKKIGDEIDQAKIEKTFIMETQELMEKLSELLKGIPPLHLEIADEIVQYAQEELHTKLSDNIYLTLTDHIHFAVIRYEQEMGLKNVLLWEIKKFYPDEFAIGEYALKIIKEKLDLTLNEDEAGFIAMHIVNARQDGQEMQDTVAMTEIVNNAVNIVSYHYGIQLDESSLNYTRFITHLKYFAQRMVKKEIIPSGDDFLYEQVQIKYPKAFECANKINHYLQEAYHTKLTKDEHVYLTIHIYRVTEKTDTKKEES